MVRLSGQVGRDMIILVLLECGIAQVAPQDGCHAKLVRKSERLRDLNDLAMRIIGSKINRRADCGRTHIVRFLDRAKQDLLKTVWIGHQLVMIDLYNERNLVRILARHHTQHAERGCDCIASAFDGKLDNVFGVEVIGVLRKARAARMFDALIHRQDRKITGSAETPVSVHPRQIAKHTIVAVGLHEDSVHKIRAG